MKRTRLRSLGFSSYWEYLQSAHWQDISRAYKASGLPTRCICGAPEVELHHRTYERLGREELTDLIPLCRLCHAAIHVFERRGVLEVGSDLAGFQSLERAAAYRQSRTDTPSEHERSQVGVMGRLLLLMRIEQKALRKRESAIGKEIKRVERDLHAEEIRLGIGVPLDQRTYEP